MQSDGLSSRYVDFDFDIDVDGKVKPVGAAISLELLLDEEVETLILLTRIYLFFGPLPVEVRMVSRVLGGSVSQITLQTDKIKTANTLKFFMVEIVEISGGGRSV